MKELVLASKSPRRRELMSFLGHPFRCESSDVEEKVENGESPGEHVRRLSLAKAVEIGKKSENAIVIGSDTVVVIDGTILGKPVSEAEAVEMLMKLCGRIHTVYTGFAFYDTVSGETISNYETTDVKMKEFTKERAIDYVATGEPMDKAGSYGIQGYGAVLIESVKGCYFNVMGFPLARVMETLYNFSKGGFGYFGKVNIDIEK